MPAWTGCCAFSFSPTRNNCYRAHEISGISFPKRMTFVNHNHHHHHHHHGRHYNEKCSYSGCQAQGGGSVVTELRASSNSSSSSSSSINSNENVMEQQDTNKADCGTESTIEKLNGQSYGMGGVDLSQRWMELVQDGHVSAIAVFEKDDDGKREAEEQQEEEEAGFSVRYGIRIDNTTNESVHGHRRLLEFVEIIKPSSMDGHDQPTTKEDASSNKAGSKSPKTISKMRQRILSIIDTLDEIQQSSSSSSSSPRFQQNNKHGEEAKNRVPDDDNNNNNTTGLAIQCIRDGPYAAQLQLVRTLRPPRSKNMESSNHNNDQTNTTTTTTTVKSSLFESCDPPPFDPSTDSFLVGPLRLFGHGEFHGNGEPRVRMAKLWVPRRLTDETTGAAVVATTATTKMVDWDVYHNISPIDPRGHFLLLPALDHDDASVSNTNWRDQSLISSDCSDVTYLASTIHPPGSLMLSFNSVGAGASQNHIHCHGWVCPPPPLVFDREEKIQCSNNIHGYAVTAAVASDEFPILHLPKGTAVSLLEYPCTCIKLSIQEVQAPVENSNNPNWNKNAQSSLCEMGDALATIVHVAQEMKAPHNVAWINSPLEGDSMSSEIESKNAVALEAYIFFRSKSKTFIPNDKSDTGIFRLGASEMLGLFHSSSKEQLESIAASKGSMEQILRDVSWEPRVEVWYKICKALKQMENIIVSKCSNGCVRESYF